MEKWFLQSMWIAMFGFFKEFRPEDPYITQYLTHPPMNFTNEEVIQDVYPVSTYTCLGLTIIVFLITDYLRYKPIVILNAMSSVIAQLLLIYTRSITSMMVMEVFYGTMTACEVAYYTYIYSKVEKKHYKKVSSHMKMACLLGRLISAILAQILIDNSVLTIPHLNYLTLLGAFFSLIWAFGLPPVKKSLYFHHNPENIHISDQTNQNFPAPKTACQRLWHDFNSAFRNNYVVQWSIWWAIGTSMYYQFMSYSQSLWQEISDEGTDFKITDNGSVEAVYTIISTLGVYLVGVMTIPSWWLIGVLTLSQGILLLKMSQEHLLSHAYVGYIIYGTFYHVMATVANCEVARNIPEDSYALVFGVNTFISLIIQTCMTVIINSSIGLKLTIRTQSRSNRMSDERNNGFGRITKRQSVSKKQNRLLSLFTIVQFDNEPCYSSSGDSGICMTSSECHQHLGVPIGSCANSYGVCCLSLTTCGQTIRENGTYFVNTGYPNSLNDTGTCQVTLHKASPYICQFRLDFERFVISGPEPINHQCDNDQFIVSGSNPVPVICGMNTGGHMYVDAGTGTSPITLTIVTSGIQFKRDWKIKISQIACDSTTKADSGCLQYHTGISGTVKSFNYDPYSGLHLSNQDYTICLRTERNFCSVQYTTCDDQMNNRSHAFTLTGNTLGQNAVQANVGSVGSSPCNSDYLIIPCVSSKQGPVASGMNTCVDRLCGGTLSTDYTTIPTTVISSVRPFRLSFHTNSVEMPNDIGNRGFCLNYIQQPCNANYS